MSQPGSFGSIVPDPDWVVRKIQELENKIKELAAADLFAPMGIHPLPGATQFDGNVTSNGQLTANGLTVNGAAVIAGTLSLPAGIINNDALLNPVQYGSVGVSEQSYVVDTTSRKRGVTNITVPAGYTKATVLTVANVNGANSTASSDILLIQAYAGGAGGGSSAATIPAGGIDSATASAINSFTGLSGGTIEVGCYVSCNAGPWASSVWNLANVNAIVWFTR